MVQEEKGVGEIKKCVETKGNYLNELEVVNLVLNANLTFYLPIYLCCLLKKLLRLASGIIK